MIAGGGPVGLALAALLAHGRCASRLRVHVLEGRAAPQWSGTHVDLRVYALSRASQRLFERLGLWQRILAGRASPYRRMRVWQGDGPEGLGSIEFDSADVGEPDLGHIVEDALIRTVLLDALRAADRCQISFGVTPQAIERQPSGMNVVIGGEPIACELLVGADGSRSQVRALAGLPAYERDYGQQAVVAHVTTERPHRETAWQRFLAGGPVAFLPLADGRSSVVWSLPRARAEQLAAARDEAFLDALQEASGGVLGRLGPISARASFPLLALHAPAYCAPNVALAGDAAHTVHPLAGQGMNLGLLDAACLAVVLEDALAAGQHPGDLRVLRCYERRRKSDNVSMLLALDGLDRLFRLPAWVAPARALGLTLVDRAVPAKRMLIRRALGLAAEAAT